MKNVILQTARAHFLLSAKIAMMVMVIGLVATSCKKDKDNKDDTVKVDDNGLTPDINNFISPEILEEIEGLGMPIYRGGNPPQNITGVYISSPDICVATNRPNDNWGPGHLFADFYVNFYEQNNSQLTIKAATAQASHSGEGTGAYIVGDSSSFSVFCPMNSTTGSGHEYKNVVIFSGILTAEGIKDFYHSTFMLEGGGIEWLLLENGQGRVVYDSDGISKHATWPNKKSAAVEAAAAESAK